MPKPLARPDSFEKKPAAPIEYRGARHREGTLSRTAIDTPPSAFTPSLPPQRRAGWLGLSPLAWMSIATVALLMASLYWPNLRRLWEKTNPLDGADRANWSHSLLVPVIGLYYLWLRREELRAAVPRPVLPQSRWSWLLGGGVTLAFVAAGTWLAATAARASVGAALGPVEPFLLPLMGVGIVAALVDLAATLGRDGLAATGRARLIGGALALLLGLTGWLVMSYGPGEALVGSTLAGYSGPACIAVAFVGLLSILLDWGLATLLAGMLLCGYGIWPGQNDYLKDLGMVVSIFGATLTLAGWGVMRIAWFPILFLVCAIPWPHLVYSKVALPLQFLAANVAVVVLNLAQVETYVEGTRIVIEHADGDRVLNVAEACAGMRSLMTFITAGAAIGFVFGDRPLWQRLIIVASAVPIAIFCNVLRVSGQGLLDVYVSQKVSEGFAHAFVGLVMLVPAFFLLLGVCWILDNLFIEEEDDPDEVAPASSPRQTEVTRA